MSTLTIKELTNPLINQIDVKSNLQQGSFAPLDSIKEYIHNSHGSSLVALSVLDPLYKNLKLEITFDSLILMNSFVEELFGIWNKYEPIPVKIRSFNLDGKFLSEFEGKPLHAETVFPTTLEEYDGNNKKVILDVEKTADVYTFKLFRWNEVAARTLIINLIH